MKVRKKFSILVMDDSGHVRRFRMRTRLFVAAMVFGFCILPLAAGLGIWLAYDYWLEARELKLNYQDLEHKYIRANAKAERLGNLEGLLHKMNPVDAEQIMQNLAEARAFKNAANAFASADPEPQVEPTGQDDSIQTVAGKAITAVNSGKVTVEKVVVKALPNRKVRISLDLVNPDQKKTISGKISCVFVAANGHSAPLTLPHDMAEFRINRLKRVVIVASLPENASSTNAAVIIETSMEGDEVAYRNAFPMLQ